MTRREAIMMSVIALAIVSLSASCKPVRQLHRFFLTRCPEQGPTREKELEVYLPPVSLDVYYAELARAAAPFPSRVVATAMLGGRAFPIHHIGPIGKPGGLRLLVVAGIHGNETAAALAAPHILSDVERSPEAYEAVEMHLIAPANPVGFGEGSRYNAQGCDANRDFETLATIEASAVREVFDRISPDLVVALHEGPHEGFFLIVPRGAPLALATAGAIGVEKSGIALAETNNLGFRLRKPGIMTEGRLLTYVKKLIRIGSLAEYTQLHGIGTLTTEGPFGSRDVEARIRAQVVAVRTIAAETRNHSIRVPRTLTRERVAEGD